MAANLVKLGFEPTGFDMAVVSDVPGGGDGDNDGDYMLETFDDFISLAVIMVMLVLTMYCCLVMSSKKHLKLMQRRQAKHLFMRLV